MNTQQRQELARVRRQRTKIQEAWQRLQNTANRVDPKFAHLGLFNVVKEDDHLANADRFRHKKEPVLFGNHWLHWNTSHNTVFLAHQQELVKRDSLGRVIQVIYQEDSINYTPHAIERLWQRSSRGIAEDYEPNLGLGDIANYLRRFNTIADSPLLNAGEVALRTDIPLPFRNGLFLGSVRLGEGSMLLESSGVGFSGRRLKFCAHTWVASDQLSSDQRTVRDLLVAQQWEDAADFIEHSVWNMEAFDFVEENQNFTQAVIDHHNNLDRSVFRI